MMMQPWIVCRRDAMEEIQWYVDVTEHAYPFVIGLWSDEMGARVWEAVP